MMIKTYLISFACLICLRVHARDLEVGIFKNNPGLISLDDFEELARCTFKKDLNEIKLNILPGPRIESYLREAKLDAAYPYPLEKSEQERGLYPVYIDEVLQISNSSKKVVKTYGVTHSDRQSLSPYLKDKEINYKVNQVESLFKGLERDRTDSIVVRRSQIPHDFNLGLYKIKSLFFEHYGIRVTQNLLFKSKTNFKSLLSRFRMCLDRKTFSISQERKSEISRKILSDLNSLSRKMNLKKRITLKDIAKKERIWHEEGKSSTLLKNTVIRSSHSLKLVKAISEFDYIEEAFLMNHQGGLIATYKITSDFDQSDEEKFISVIKNKNFNTNHISDLYYDDSINKFLIGLSFPLKNKKGEILAILYIGADINKLLTHYSIN